MQISKCGLDCEKCGKREEVGCSGCNEMTVGYWGERCEIKDCCGRKHLEHCGFCADFPCDMLRELSYDDEHGDDGERLLAAKQLADSARDKKEKRIKNFLLGASLGGIFGVIIGAWQSAVPSFVFAGIIVGLGIALMTELYKK